MLLPKTHATWADLMAVYWVQQFFTLPIIYENSGMGDEYHQARHPALAGPPGTARASQSDQPFVPFRQLTVNRRCG